MAYPNSQAQSFALLVSSLCESGEGGVCVTGVIGRPTAILIHESKSAMTSVAEEMGYIHYCRGSRPKFVPAVGMSLAGFYTMLDLPCDDHHWLSKQAISMHISICTCLGDMLWPPYRDTLIQGPLLESMLAKEK